MDSAQAIFQGQNFDSKKLLDFGFQTDGEDYVYETVLPDSGFVVTVRVDSDGQVRTEVVDPAVDEPYILHLTDEATGAFVGGVRADYDAVLEAIAENCLKSGSFQADQAKAIIDYIRNTYGDELEYLWEKFPEDAIVRRQDNRKWYLALLQVSRRKLGLPSDEVVEIIDLRRSPEEDLKTLVDHEKYFPGWHMNKKNWYTIILDGSVKTEEICRRIDESYKAAEKK